MSKLLDPQAFWESVKSEDSPAWPVVCVDLNGVLDIPSHWNGNVEKYPVAPGASLFLFRLRQHFNTVVIFTATLPVSLAVEWLEENGLLKFVHYVTNHKVPAKVYIDDKAVCHEGNFEDTLRRAIKHKPHWQKATYSIQRPEAAEHFLNICEGPFDISSYNKEIAAYIRELEDKLHDLERSL